MIKYFIFLLPLALAYSSVTLELGTITRLSCNPSTEPPCSTMVLNTPIAAASDSGQLIVVWSTTTTTAPREAVQSSVFRNGTWTSLPNIAPGFDDFFPWVGMDALGNAVIGWIELIAFAPYVYNIDGATLTSSATAWSAPTPINTVAVNIVPANVQLARSSDGNITVATWIASGTLYSSNLTSFANNSWSSPVATIGSTTGTYQLIINPLDIPYAAVTTSTGLSVTKQSSLSSWMTQANFTGGSNGSLGFASSGNGVAVWQDTAIEYSTYDNSTSTWSSVNPIPSSTGGTTPTIGVAASGYAVAAWIENNQTYASTYTDGTWSTPVILSATGYTNVDPPQIAVDAHGDAVLVWGDSPPGEPGIIENIELAFLPFGGSWQVQTLTSADINESVSGLTMTPTLAVSPNGTMVITWETTADQFVSTEWVEALNGLIVQSLLPPSSFTGVKKQNRFLFQNEFYDVLEWTASPSTNIVNYNIYRNGTLIAEVSVNTLTYTDHRRGKREVDTYSLTAVTPSGQESAPITVTVQ